MLRNVTTKASNVRLDLSPWNQFKKMFVFGIQSNLMYPIKRLWKFGHKNAIKHKKDSPRFSHNPQLPPQKNLKMTVHLCFKSSFLIQVILKSRLYTNLPFTSDKLDKLPKSWKLFYSRAFWRNWSSEIIFFVEKIFSEFFDRLFPIRRHNLGSVFLVIKVRLKQKIKTRLKWYLFYIYKLNTVNLVLFVVNV